MMDPRHVATADENLIDELEAAIEGRSVSRRADVLKRITDLFLSGQGGYGNVQTELFDDVLFRLVSSVDAAAKARFGKVIARLPEAPAKTARLLAFDPDIRIAGDLLSHCESLGEQDLKANATTMSQDHLLAISKRRELTEGITDVLVARGNREVLVSTATNNGSRFSKGGLERLIEKSEKDEDIALSLWSRTDIPRQQMVLLFRQASEGLRLQLEAADPRRGAEIRTAVSAASDELMAEARARSLNFKTAQAQAEELRSTGRLTEATVATFVQENKFDCVCASLALLCDMPIVSVERMLAQGREEQLLLVAKAAGFSWQTTYGLLRFQACAVPLGPADADRLFASFTRMKAETARLALNFYRKRQSVS